MGPGEEVLLVREPLNAYDRYASLISSVCLNQTEFISNAIQVKNIGRTQVGHLPRKVASQLASLLDRHMVTVEGVINDGNCEFFFIPIPTLLTVLAVSRSKGYTLSMYVIYSF